jgi:hypothetical protein
METLKLESLSFILGSFKQAELKVFRDNYVRSLAVNHKKLLLMEGISDRWVKEALSKSQVPKAVLQSVCAIPFASKTIYECFLQSIPANVRTVFEELLTCKILHEEQIEELFQVSVTHIVEVERPYSYSRTYKARRLREPFQNFLFDVRTNSNWDNVDKKYLLSIPLPLRIFLLQNYYTAPEYAQIIPLKQVPETTGVMEDMGGIVLTEIAALKLLTIQGGVSLGARGKVGLTLSKKVQRQLSIVEFFPDTEAKYLANLRTTFLLSLLGRPDTSSFQLSEHVLLRHLLTLHLKYDKAAVNILGYFKGINTAYTYDYLQNSSLNRLIKELSELPVNEWISVDNILGRIQYYFLEVDPISPHDAAGELSLKPGNNPKQKHEIPDLYVFEYNFEELVFIPFIKGVLFFLASFGIFDIRYNAPENPSLLGVTYKSPYDGLVCVRLTQLGCYLLNLTDTFTPPKVLVKTQLHILEDTLVITADQADELNNLLLEPFTNRIGPARFMTDFKTFLKGCFSRSDIQNKIDLFRNTIQQDLPPNWEAFFEELKGKIDPFDMVNMNYIVFRIPPDNKALVRLIARDEQLKIIVLKAEAYHILVPVSLMNAFKKRLAEFGYMLT